MPGLTVDHAFSLNLVHASVPFASRPSASELVVDLWLYPASFPISGLIVAVCAWSLRRQGQTRAAALWIAAWFVGNAVEVLTKWLLVRPALFLDGVRVSQFDQSLPSGHTLRSVLVAAAVAYVWPRAAWWVAAWAASVVVILVPAGWHTPTDVLGGLLLAGALVLGVREHAVVDRVDHGSFAAGSRHEREPRPVEPQA
jgi:membrane-associated phospholipid phosphatase